MLSFAEVYDIITILQFFFDDALRLQDIDTACIDIAQAFGNDFILDLFRNAMGCKNDDALIYFIKQFFLAFAGIIERDDA